MSDEETALQRMTVRAAQTTLPAQRPPDGGPVLSLRDLEMRDHPDVSKWILHPMASILRRRRRQDIDMQRRRLCEDRDSGESEQLQAEAFLEPQRLGEARKDSPRELPE